MLRRQECFGQLLHIIHPSQELESCFQTLLLTSRRFWKTTLKILTFFLLMTLSLDLLLYVVFLLAIDVESPVPNLFLAPRIYLISVPNCLVPLLRHTKRNYISCIHQIMLKFGLVMLSSSGCRVLGLFFNHCQDFSSFLNTR